ncbi:unnamed protein product [Burkholderia pseudomallei]|nr:unnamed protein product [Burkholderia pseudomallei]
MAARGGVGGGHRIRGGGHARAGETATLADSFGRALPPVGARRRTARCISSSS